MTPKLLNREMVIDLLGTSAMSHATIARELVARGDVDGDAAQVEHELGRSLQLDTAFTEVADGVVYLPGMVDGTVWTVWVDADDAAEGFLRAHPHLATLTWWLVGDQETVELVDEAGTSLGVLETDGFMLDGIDTDVILGPSGWLDGLGGQWVAVSVVGRTLRCTPCGAPPPVDARQVAAVEAGFRRAVDADELRRHNVVDRGADPRATELRFTGLSEPMDEALIADRSAFLRTPIAPIPDVYTAAGLEIQNGLVAEAGVDWEALRVWQTSNRLGWLYGLDADQRDLLIVLVRSFEVFAEHGADGLAPDPAEVGAVTRLLTGILERNDLAEPFWSECSALPVSPKTIGEMVDWLVAAGDGGLSPGLGWLRSRVLEAAGDVIGADAVLRSLATGDCRHEPLLIDAAAFASDRGDAVSALALLTRAGVVDRLRSRSESDDFDFDSLDDAELLLQEVAGFARHRPTATARRNDPCPCGSGRKYKACHLGKEQHALSDRSNWLYEKACRFERRTEDQGHALGHRLAGSDHELLDSLSEGPLLADLALHEGGAFEEFLEARAALLPDDEALLAAQWALVDRSVFEARAVGDDWLDLYDLGRGESIRVVNTAPARDTHVGTLMFGRPLPVGDTYRALSGFVAVGPEYVDDLLEATDARDLDRVIEVLAAMFMPPRLSNTDGEPMVLHTIRWRVPDASVVDAALRSAGLVRDDDEPEWFLGRPAAGEGVTIIASLKLDGGDLVGEVNSVERADRLRELVGGALPGVEVVDETVRDASNVDAARRAFDALGADGVSPARAAADRARDPAMREIAARMMADHESRWVDEPVPALGGRTPRDAVTDPIGREQVVRLLDSFPIPADGAIAMDSRRLRAVLGIE